MAGCSTSPAPATSSFPSQGYLQDTAGNNAVIKALGYDSCIRTSDWTPARATIECDPDLVPKPVAQAPAAPPVAPRAPTPAPQTKIAPVPPPVLAATPTPQRFTLSTDAMFDFNKSTLRPGGRKKLDDLAAALKGSQHDAIVATGHTDRVGSARYNLRLSEQRAAAVKRHLQSKGLDAGKITALGKGNTQPVTKPGDCPRGKLSNAVLFACLQPDRRVEIEVSGAKSIDPSTPATVAPSEPKAKAVGSTSNALAKAKAGKAKPRPKNKILIGQ